MALNLSRNTKVFVSSANGVPTESGQFKTGYVKAPGSNYAVGAPFTELTYTFVFLERFKAIAFLLSY